MKRHDLIVIGGGVGGLVTASVAGQLGLDVVLIERGEHLGGDCLHHGCVPSKTLIRSAEVAHLARRAAEFGIQTTAPVTDLGAVMDRVRDVIAAIQPHDDPERFRGYGVDVRFGEARFTGPRTVSVDGTALHGRRFVIATGSRPAVAPIPGLEAAGYLTNETLFAQRVLPRRLAVLGGGPIGLELAQSFARLGAEVTVLERAGRILPREDDEVTAELQALLRREGLTIHTGTTVERVSVEHGQKQVHCRGSDATWTLAVDEILVATGRQPNTERLELEQAGVAVAPTGIPVDARLRTSAGHIYACGDVVGPFPFTHMAEYQAGIIIANAVFRVPKRVNYRVVPWVTYTRPELAQVGLTEQAARDRGLAVQIARIPFRNIDRALAEGSGEGLMKLVVHKRRVAGATILGPHAGELIHEMVLAMQARVPVSTIAAAIHAYPTFSQVHRRSVNTLLSARLFAPRTRRLVRWIARWLP
jgi:pyruvate/2-oxoglutarate dehydrogenase complex dihydrolipoamide dehydrogenase (E3) component